tara:strand:+ start:912 stop:1187 length:276 start_codon:yes stop_codon:yes gene_type:complete
MYNQQEILKDLARVKELIEDWKNDLQQNEKDLLKFYKKGHRRAGVRLRRQLKTVIDNIQLLRLDIKRLYKERDIFKGTELDKDFKRTKSST